MCEALGQAAAKALPQRMERQSELVVRVTVLRASALEKFDLRDGDGQLAFCQAALDRGDLFLAERKRQFQMRSFLALGFLLHNFLQRGPGTF